ncbi:N-acetylglucosamine-6-phosphate deacetylase [Paenibacillus glucanolyticus]|uniref:N-acetylglucosamine-6-phosphate deacetylase n=1 Tax=Paenibacillus glucanolyticus TaxID=59843 RepID=UPI00128D7165|nr:amidohydrolase family protein [Paenibacillus glucanolyticus]MPY18998.1 amidohydrolase family protein [Paenibacillus glucanolyticus]
MDSQRCVRTGLHYASEERIQVTWSPDGRIDSLLPGEGEEKIWIAPGLIDLQINGGYGYDLNSLPLTTDTVIQVTRRLWEKGVTLYYPTVITNGDDEIEQILRVIDAACLEDERVGSTIGGVHVEGPFISSEEGPRGAHDSRFIKAPDWGLFTRWQAASGNRIRILTLSPEWPNAADFIRKCVSSGIVVSIGHTAATPAQIREAVAAGATMSTHLGNGAHLTLPRHPNYIWEQLAQDQLWAGMITDGYHLPDSVIKVILRAKLTKALLVSDAVYLSGMPPGEYETHIGGDVILTPEGRLHLARKPELLAGSAMMLLEAVQRLAESGLCSFPEAWDMASMLPAQAMGLADYDGLKRGARADFVLLEKREGSLRVLETVKGGHSVYRAEG